ncbi:HTH-type transcriptional regulator XynR [subsurface metagenome]
MSSIEKSIKILNLLSNAKESVKVSEICSKLLLPKSTVHRILNVLLNHSLVSKEKDTSKYRLGFQVLKYANSFNDSFDFREIARPILKNICKETDLTTYLTGWYDGHSICIDSIRPSRVISTHFSVEINKEMPFHCTSSSKVILAYQSPEEIKRVIYEQPLKKYTPKTIVDPKKMEEQLSKIKENGFAICDEELESGVKAVAVPIRNIYGKVIASITIVGLANRIHSNNIGRLIEILLASTQQLSKMLGYKGNDIL